MKARIRAISAAVAAMALGLGVYALTNTPQIAASGSSPAVSRTDAIARVRQLTAEVKRVDRIEAKLTTFGLLQVAERSGDVVNGIAPGTQVWVVSTGGEFQPAFGRGERFPWGVEVLDATTGNSVASFAGPKGTWPAWFDKIVDQAP